MIPVNSDRPRKPDWLKIHLPKAGEYRWMHEKIRDQSLHTICTSGKCPNAGECWSLGTATFMILGDICTRACRFCNVTTGKPLPPDEEEPLRIARTIESMQLKHAVITSVDRDDLPDGGAGVWVTTIRAIKELNPGLTMEVLIPDFNGNTEMVQLILEAGPELVSHNLETVRRLTPQIRTRAKYDTSLEVLRYIAEAGIAAKSGLMLGLGETAREVTESMNDLREAGVEVLTLGQYLQPSRKNVPVQRYVSPEEFESFRQAGLSIGFRIVESAPLVRSSYRSHEHVRK